MNLEHVPPSYPVVILCLDALSHDIANDWECEDPDCICHWEHRTEEYDAMPEAWCDCESCQYVRSVLALQ